MPDRRTVDELSIEELEEILTIRKREAREARLQRLRGEGRVIEVADLKSPPVQPDRSAGEAIKPTSSYYRSSEVIDEQDSRRRLSLRPSRSRVRTWRDRFLLLVEIGALVGLVAVIISLEQSRLATNQPGDTTNPTPVPTPLITAVVLPSGHRPPTAPGGAAPNLLDEVPAHLRDYVQSITPMPIPTPGPGQPTRIQIPALNVDAQVVEGDDWDQLKKGVGHHIGSANPGERGNVVLSGHDDIFGEIFKHLDQLKSGDEVIVYSGNQRYRYIVTNQRLVPPTQVDVMLPTSDPTVTLISCYPYLIDTQRIAVFAQLAQ
jgi:sortase A